MRHAAEGGELASALTPVNCLAITAVTDEPDQVSLLIDLVKALKVEKKELLIFTEGKDLSSWPTLNKSINFNVIISRSHLPTTGAQFNSFVEISTDFSTDFATKFSVLQGVLHYILI